MDCVFDAQITQFSQSFYVIFYFLIKIIGFFAKMTEGDNMYPPQY